MSGNIIIFVDWALGLFQLKVDTFLKFKMWVYDLPALISLMSGNIIHPYGLFQIQVDTLLKFI